MDGNVFLSAMHRWIAPLRNRVLNLVMKAVVKSLSTSTALNSATVQLLDGEEKDVTVVQAFGFCSRLPVGAQAIVVFPGGNRAQGIAIATDLAAQRPALSAEGDTAIYNTDGGTRACVIKLSGDGIVIETPSGGTVGLTCPNGTVTATCNSFSVNGGNLEVTG